MTRRTTPHAGPVRSGGWLPLVLLLAVVAGVVATVIGLTR